MPDTEVDAERERLAALRSYHVLDTRQEAAFDDIVALAGLVCNAPLAAVSLIDHDRQWYKARLGIDVCEMDRDVSFCARAMYGEDVMQVPDLREDPRFKDWPVVAGDPYVRFYAGAPLVTSDGHPLGSLCVLDFEPRQLSPAECRGLRTLAAHVMSQLELRQYARGLDAAHERLSDAERIKDEFLSRVSHELRTPLAAISGYLELIGDNPARGADFLERIRRNSDRLLALVEDMLLAAQAGRTGIALDRSEFDLAALARAAAAQNGVLAAARGLSITADAAAPVTVHADARRLGEALDRLILNAIKFTPRGSITVAAFTREGDAVVEVRDTGIGISAEDRDRVLTPFTRAASSERDAVPGAGLGLPIVKAIVDSHGGTIAIESEPGEGATVVVTLPLPPGSVPFEHG